MNFPTADQFQQKTLKFGEISTGIYCVMDLTERQSKFEGISLRELLNSENGDEVYVWLSQRLGVPVVTAGVPCYIKYDGKELNPTDPTQFFYKYNVCRYVV